MAILTLLLQVPFTVCAVRLCIFLCILISFGTRAGTKVLLSVSIQKLNIL